MVSQRHVDAGILEEFIRLARRQFAIIPVGESAGVASQVFRRAMRRLRRLRWSWMRDEARDRLLILRRAAAFRTRGSSHGGGLLLCGQCIYPLSNFPVLLLCESCGCFPVMPRCRRICPSDVCVMMRILRAVRLQFNRLPVGVDDERINRIYRRGLRWRQTLGSPWVGIAARRIRILRDMTEFRTSGAGKLCFELDFEVWVLLSKGVYCIPISLTLFLSLSVGGVGDWRVRFLSDVFLAVEADPELPDWVKATLATTWG